MISYWTILTASAPVFLIIALGAALRKTGAFARSGDQALIDLVLNVLYPMLIVKNVLGNPSLLDASLVGTAMGLGFGLLALSLAIGLLAAKLLRLQRGAGRRTFPLAVGVQNYGLLPIPIIEALYPARAQELIGVTFLFILGLELATWTLGIACFGASSRGGWRRIINAPILAIVGSLALNGLGAGAWLPEMAKSTVALVADASIPINLILVGGVLADFFGECDWRGCAKVVLGGSLVRLAVLPAIYFAVARWVPMPSALRFAVIIQGCMPSAVFPVLLAKHYGGHVPTAVQVVLATSVLGFVLVPLLIMAGQFIGLRP